MTNLAPCSTHKDHRTMYMYVFSMYTYSTDVCHRRWRCVHARMQGMSVSKCNAQDAGTGMIAHIHDKHKHTNSHLLP